MRAKLVFSSGEAEEISVMDLNRADWIEEDDGYYYYKKVLPVGGQTESLLTAVKIAEDCGNRRAGLTGICMSMWKPCSLLGMIHPRMLLLI